MAVSRAVHVGTRALRQTPTTTQPKLASTQTSCFNFVRGGGWAQNARDEKLDQLLKKYHNGKNRCLIFVLYKKEAPRLEQTLTRKGHKVVAIHGDMTQEGRLRALEGFKNGAIHPARALAPVRTLSPWRTDWPQQ
jgi:superfamily II DNA/RNA helicase